MLAVSAKRRRGGEIINWGARTRNEGIQVNDVMATQ